MNSSKACDSESQEASDSSSLDNERSHKYTISQTLFDNLQQMGFSENAIKKSIIAGCIDQSTCVQWITIHAGHPELDAPVSNGSEVVIQCKKVLTEEERERKVKELQVKIKEKKEHEMRELYAKKREHMEEWRKSLDVRDEMEAVRRKAYLDELKKKKAADFKARRDAKVSIIADRYIRQGKGVDEAHALAIRECDEHLLNERQKAAFGLENLNTLPSDKREPDKGEWNLDSLLKTNTSSATALDSLYTASPPKIEELPTLVNDIRSTGNEHERAECLRVLRTIFANIRDNPFDVKKRTLKTNSKSLTRHIFRHASAVRIMQLCNFNLEVDTNYDEVFVCKTVVVHLLNQVLKLLE